MNLAYYMYVYIIYIYIYIYIYEFSLPSNSRPSDVPFSEKVMTFSSIASIFLVLPANCHCLNLF